MSCREEVLRLLDLKNGLKCLPRFLKAELRKVMERLSEDELQAYRREQLAILEKYVEPLWDQQDANGKLTTLAQELRSLSAANTWSGIAKRLGVELPSVDSPDELRGQFLEWTCKLRDAPSKLLFCTGCQLAASILWVGVYLALLAFLPGLASGLRKVGAVPESVELLEEALGLSGQDYRNRQSLQKVFAQSPLQKIAVNNQALLLRELAVGLSQIGEKSQSLSLLETWVGQPMSEFANCEKLRPVQALNRVTLVLAWLRCADPTKAEVLATCRALVEYIRSLRHEELPTPQQRMEFLDKMKGVKGELRRVGLGAADAKRRLGREGVHEAEQLELELLYWLEQLENRTLVERIGLIGRNVGSDGGDIFRSLRPYQPALRPPERGGEAGLSERNEMVLEGQSWALCLSEVAIDPQELSSSRASDTHCALNAGSQNGDSWESLPSDSPGLETLVPEGAVWLRSVFDDEGRLRWWAYQATGGRLRRLAAGTSETGAEGRLNLALLKADLAIERVWFDYEGKTLCNSWVVPLRRLSDALNNSNARKDFQGGQGSRLFGKPWMSWNVWSNGGLPTWEGFCSQER